MAEEKTTAYQRIRDIVDKVVDESKKTVFGNIDSVSLIEKLQQYAPQIESAYTAPLKQQVSESTSKLTTKEEVNRQLNTKLSGLETSLGEEKENYTLFKKEILRIFLDNELESELYRREEESIAEAEVEDAKEGIEKMGLKEFPRANITLKTFKNSLNKGN